MRTTQQRIMLLLSLLALGFLATVIAWQGLETQRARLLGRSAAEERHRFFDRIITLKGDTLEALAFDYTFWDEMVRYVQTRDPTWARENLDSALTTYHVSGSWVYDTNGALVYGVTEHGRSPLPLPAPAPASLFGKERFCHFYLPTRDGMLEVRGATIHPTKDRARTGPFAGYFFAGRLWDAAYVRELGQLTGMRVSLLPPDAAPPALGDPAVGRIAFTTALPGWDGRPVMRLSAEGESSSGRILSESAARSVTLLALFASLLLALLFGCLWLWVSRPLRQIAAALHAQDPAPLARLEGDRAEFGEVARLIHAFFHQREALVREVQERQQAEEALHRSQEHLVQAQKMEAVGRLAGGIAHDFNNMLSVISGHTELMRERANPEDPAWRGLEEIGRAVDRAAALTAHLLAFSRKQVLTARALDLNASVRGMEEMLRPVIGEPIRIVTDLSPDAGCVRCDPGQLSQVLMNLALNARDAMPEGGQLTIQTRREAPPDHAGAMPELGWAMLLISDTGTGMDPEVRAHLFEPFFTTRPPGHGTGLGLATVYGIVQQCGGRIDVETAPGQGSTFRIYLPRVAPEAAPARAAADPLSGHETILLVEDEQMVRELMEEVLRGGGYTVLAAAAGEEALDIAGRHAGSIDLLLTDIVMPGISGRQLAEQLAGVRPETRVLYMSGYTEDDVLRLGVLASSAAFIRKPFALGALNERIREILAADAPPPA